jgi:hypothetical protein
MTFGIAAIKEGLQLYANGNALEIAHACASEDGITVARAFTFAHTLGQSHNLVNRFDYMERLVAGH